MSKKPLKIYKVYGCDYIGEFDIEEVKRSLPNAELFIYNYEAGSYEGTGFALWKEGDRYGYAYMAHCSCNGPVDGLNSIMYPLENIKKLAEKGDYEWDMAPAVIKKLERLLQKGEDLK